MAIGIVRAPGVSWLSMTTIDQIPVVIDRVRDGFADGVVRAVVDRETQLEQLRRPLVEREPELADALNRDLGKSPIEAYSTEIGFTINEVAHALRRLRSWTQPHKVSVPLHLRPGSARILPQPLGTVLVIAPWNYPVQLLLGPLVPALAAGNTVVLKPSEVAGATAEVLAELIPRYLDERAVQVVTGGVEETSSCEGGPNRSSTFCPGGGVKSTTISSSPAATSVTGRCVRWAKPSVRTTPPSGTRVSRCAVDSTTTSVSPSTNAPLGSASPVATVVTSPSASRRTAPL